MEGPPRTHPGPAPDPPPGPPRTSAAPFGIKATEARWARNPRGVPRSIDLDVPLSPPLTTKTTDSRTHAKLYGGLLDSDTFTGQYSQTRVQRRERRRPPTERSKRQRSVRPAAKRYKLQESYHGKYNSLELHLSTAGFKSEGTRSSLIGASQCFVAIRSKSSPALEGPTRHPPRASNKRSYQVLSVKFSWHPLQNVGTLV
jgi:hypothetical protein